MIKNDCRITVIVTTYNRKYEVRRALESVYAQTKPPYEVILVDDGSTDGTQEYIESFHFPGLNYLHLENNVGVSAARNAGIRNAQGEFIAFLDSDNEWAPSKLEVFENEIVNDTTGIDLWCSKYKKHIGFSVFEWPIGFGSYIELSDEEIWIHSLADASATVYRKSFLDEMGGFTEEMMIHIDWELLLRAKKTRGLTVHKIDQVMSENWDMFDCLSRNAAEDQRERLFLLTEYETEIFDNDLHFYYFSEYVQYIRQITGSCDEVHLFRQIYDASCHKERWLSVFHQRTAREKRQLENSLCRKNNFYSFLYDWMNLKLSQDSVAERLVRRGYRKVAIYGAGKHGILLYHDLCDSDVEVLYFIDKNKTLEKEIKIPVLTMEEELPEADCIVITPFLETAEIKEDLEKVATCDMIALNELVKK